jgi:hypothetical protein
MLNQAILQSPNFISDTCNKDMHMARTVDNLLTAASTDWPLHCHTTQSQPHVCFHPPLLL